MKTPVPSATNSRAFASLLLSILCIVIIASSVVLAGCEDKSEPEGPYVRGQIVSIGEAELQIEAATDSNEFLSGLVRVDFSQIDKGIIESLKIGDTIIVTYSGAVGMSSPPFISAETLEVKQ